MRFDDENGAQNELLREFCLQIVHEPITISANGFFNIDFDLLGSVNIWICSKFTLEL